MTSVQAFIANYSAPKSLDELLEIWKTDHTSGTVEHIRTQSGKDTFVYSVPRWAKSGDVVFLMHTGSSIQHIKNMTKKYLAIRNTVYNDRECRMIEEALTHAQETYDAVGGKIYAIAQVAAPPENIPTTDEDRKALHWRSTIHAGLQNVYLLKNAIALKTFKHLVSFSQQSSFTTVFGDAFQQLKDTIFRGNPDIPSWFRNSVSAPVPLTKTTRENFLEVAGTYRRRFILESQFRAYYVDYLLPLLGDRKAIYRECRCKKNGKPYTWVDNVIVWNKKYLPVEVKLNTRLEKDLPGQLQQYMHVSSH